MTCLHCGKNKRQKDKRGLCMRCYLTPAIRAATPLSASKFVGHKHRAAAGDARYAHVPVHDGPADLPLPAEPTAHPPGTPEKVAVMQARVARGERPCHPLDAGAA